MLESEAHWDGAPGTLAGRTALTEALCADDVETVRRNARYDMIASICWLARLSLAWLSHGFTSSLFIVSPDIFMVVGNLF